MDAGQVVITGGTSGIGFATACQLAAHGHMVLLVGRDEPSAVRAAQRLCDQVPAARVQPLAADHARLDDVRRLADRISAEVGAGPPLAALVLAAAVANPPAPAMAARTIDGFDPTLAVNHLAPSLLRWRLASSLAPDTGRVVLLGSSQHTAIRALDHATFLATPLPPRRRYQLTKLLTLLALRAHALRGTAPVTVAVDPGFVRTRLGRSATGGMRLLLALTRPIQAPPARAAALIARTIADQSLPNGSYLAEHGPARRSALAADDGTARLVEEWTRALLMPWLTP